MKKIYYSNTIYVPFIVKILRRVHILFRAHSITSRFKNKLEREKLITE